MKLRNIPLQLLQCFLNSVRTAGAPARGKNEGQQVTYQLMISSPLYGLGLASPCAGPVWGRPRPLSSHTGLVELVAREARKESSSLMLANLGPARGRNEGSKCLITDTNSHL